MELVWLIYMILIFDFIRTGKAQIQPYLIDCGTDSSVIVNGRKWVGDLYPDNSNMTISSLGTVASTPTVSPDTVYGSLYNTARVFTEPSNYNFQVIRGNYFVRIHFYPSSYESLNMNESTFNVLANNLKLVTDFNVVGEISRKNSYLEGFGSNFTYSSLIKEFLLSVNASLIVIKFLPTHGSFAFVNAMEIIPVSGNLFIGSANGVGGGSLDSSSLSSRGIETMYRLNMGGPRVEAVQDQGLWRVWESDSSYTIAESAFAAIKNRSKISYASPNDSVVAPLLVYQTARGILNAQVVARMFNMSWKFDVDPNFEYLVRLHFCELVYNKEGQRVFKIYINNRTAAESFDIFARAGGKGKAYHEDYVDAVGQRIDTLWIQLGPDMANGATYTDALLNGLEIFKLSTNGNLARFSDRSQFDGLGTLGGSKSRTVWLAIGLAILVIALLSALAFAFYCFSKGGKKTPLFKKKKDRTANTPQSKTANANGAIPANRTGKRFTIAEIRAATKNFDESLVIGAGGFGNVYKGVMENGKVVAIKRANPQSQQGLREFETEIEMLSKLRHKHLVAMIGYCEESNEMILVYEYMANGTLRSHLFGSDLPPLSWKQRLDVSIGAARGLHYLHTGAEGGIIHRDVKTTNILLDENFVAKVADFGLSKEGPSCDRTHVSTAVKGSFGYLDPEYYRRQQLTDKSDVYSFGVVLFEVVCARPVINPTLPREQINLADWAIRCRQQGSLEKIVDPHLNENYSLESLKKFGEIAEKCLAEEGKNRPTMGEVLWHLEYVLQLHEAYTRGNQDELSVMTEVSYTDSSLPLIG